MKIVILTTRRRGIASRCLPVLHAAPGIEVARVIFSHGLPLDAARYRRRKLRKALRIGALGALNGIRMRRWYADPGAEDLFELCSALHVPLEESEVLNSDRTRQALRAADADLGLSLGNGYIAKSVYSIPRFGMLNIHTEVLPRFKGARSIIWPIHEGITETGFTIHQIDPVIDNGPILYQQKLAIEFQSTLRATVQHNLARMYKQIPGAFCHVCSSYEDLRAASTPQPGGEHFTTPSLWQFLRMLRNHSKLRRSTT